MGGRGDRERTLVNTEPIACEVRGDGARPVGTPRRIALLSAVGELRDRLEA